MNQFEQQVIQRAQELVNNHKRKYGEGSPTNGITDLEGLINLFNAVKLLNNSTEPRT